LGTVSVSTFREVKMKLIAVEYIHDGIPRVNRAWFSSKGDAEKFRTTVKRLAVERGLRLAVFKIGTVTFSVTRHALVLFLGKLEIGTPFDDDLIPAGDPPRASSPAASTSSAKG